MTNTSSADAFFSKHKNLLQQAVEHLGKRECWAAFPELPSEKIFGPGSKQAAQEEFERQCANPLELAGHPQSSTVAGEQSPYGLVLDVAYPAADAATLIEHAKESQQALTAAGSQARFGWLLESLDRLKARSLTTALEVMHTTGQGYMMAFQAGAAHALDRALESLAQAQIQFAAIPNSVRWEKPMGKHPPAVLDKTYAAYPRGIALAIGCRTFPTWNTLPGVFASLVCGCPVIVKPHPQARLPLAQAVRILREAAADAGLPADAVQLAADDENKPLALELAKNPAVRVIDYTGSSAFGKQLEEAAPHANILAEKSGVNSVVIDSFADIDGMTRNLAMGLALYSGQMCTAPQNIFIVREQFEQIAASLSTSIEKLLGDDARAAEILGVAAAPEIAQRIDKARSMGKVVLDSRSFAHPVFASTTVRTPLLIESQASDTAWHEECFGPVAFLIPVDSAEHGIELFAQSARERGALSASLYADSTNVQQQFEAAAADAGVSIAVNLTGSQLINHSSSYSDFHGSGSNPAATACITDASFIAQRYFVFQTRRNAQD